MAELGLAPRSPGSCPEFFPSPHQPLPEFLRPLLLWALEATGLGRRKASWIEFLVGLAVGN